MGQPRISVIIPVYNVEKYLERCVNSVLTQTMSDLEIILVDDGSPDASPAICDRYAAAETRIRVIHKQNGGLASARNAGLRTATGKYIFFLDSDDWLEPDGMDLLFNTAEKYQVDFVRYRAIRTGWPGLPENAPARVEPVRELTEGYYDRDRILKEIYPRLLATPQLTLGAIVGACGSLYNRAFLEKNNLAFYEEVKFSEDLIYNAHVVKAAQSFYFLDCPCVYHYYYNHNSISKSFRVGRWQSCKETVRLAEEGFIADEEYDFSLQLNYLRWFCVFLSLKEKRFLNNRRERVLYCRSILLDPMISSLVLRNAALDVSWKQWILMLLVKMRWFCLLDRLI